MPKTREKYIVAGVDLYHLRNRNEKRVIRCLAETITRLQIKNLSAEAVSDACALALNQLPARYTQRGTIVLRDPVTKRSVEKAVAEALEHVLHHPK
ncbi:late competence development ComFB family protein [Desulfovibrio sp. OttesenSCG-928-M14]|nr:late competence development ComFB family protein [Desulfovibrio sp. OttesenSCG-928-M14]MDL2290528.1 late competence development ComFB family protein [Desulfovibrio sp. OttesenSCG-928-F20]